MNLELPHRASRFCNTFAFVTSQEEKLADKPSHKTDKKLNEALKHTFPASDPITPGDAETIPSRPIERKPAEIDKSSVDRIAEQIPKNK